MKWNSLAPSLPLPWLLLIGFGHISRRSTKPKMTDSSAMLPVASVLAACRLTLDATRAENRANWDRWKRDGLALPPEGFDDWNAHGIRLGCDRTIRLLGLCEAASMAGESRMQVSVSDFVQIKPHYR
jgi:hypothetical protein